MRTKLISGDKIPRSSAYERYYYECPCGKGDIVEEHDNIPGFRDHAVYIRCEECKKHYDLDTTNDVRSWELVENE